MRKILAVVILAGLAPYSIANDTGVYIYALNSIGKLKFESTDGELIKETSNRVYNFGIGYDSGQFRFDFNYKKHGKININSDINIDVKSHSYRGLYNFNNKGTFQPFLGLKLGFGKVKANGYNGEIISLNGWGYKLQEGKTIILAPIAGIDLKLSKNLFINVSTESSFFTLDLRESATNIGIRYKF